MPRQCALLHYAQDSASESSELSIRKSNMVTASAGVVCEFPKHQEEQQPTNEEQDQDTKWNDLPRKLAWFTR